LSTTRGRPTSPTQGALEAVANVRDLKKTLGYSDKDIADKIGVNQSSVNRALGRVPLRWTPTLVKICNYAENVLEAKSGEDFQETGKARLADAVAEVWDGTPDSLDRLLRLLHLLAELQPRR
jgi:transcriptional regulator with XRE-family HTH domain